MAWIESHSTLARHPKTLRLARRLGVSVPTAIGHLHLLWWWALEYAQDGDVSAFDDEEVADACCWEGEPAAFRRALTAAGFLDDGGAVHDWDAYTVRLMERRERQNEQARLRMQAYRERQKAQERNPQEVTQNVTRNGSERYAPTVPNPTVTNQSSTTPVGKGHAADADAPAPPKPRGNPKVTAVVDALRSEGMRGTITPRDAKAIKDTEHDPQEVAAMYAAVFRGEYGDDFMHKNLSVSLCLEKLPGWLSEQAGHHAPAKTNGRQAQNSAVMNALEVIGEELGRGSGAGGTAHGGGRAADPAVGARPAGHQLRRQLPG
jgi:hypothetical protein